jgi:ParB/Sulfiredoxin domain
MTLDPTNPTYRVLGEFSLPIDQIIVDPALQPRVRGVDQNHVNALAQAPERLPPITVVKRDGKIYALDGFHRLEVARQQGIDVISVIELEVPPDADLRSIAYGLNAAHGLPLTMADRQAEAIRLLKVWPSLSDREGGRRTGLAAATIAKLRSTLERDSQIPQVPARVGRDGRSYATAPKGSKKRVDLITFINGVADAFDPRTERKIVRYLRELADNLERQDALNGYDTIDDAVRACRTILGDQGSKELAERLGWSSGNIFEIAKTLGYRAEGES